MAEHERSAEDVPRGVSASPDDARQGEVILRSSARRWIFFGGLAACVLVLALAAFLA